MEIMKTRKGSVTLISINETNTNMLSRYIGDDLGKKYERLCYFFWGKKY